MTCHYPDLGSTSDWMKQISAAKVGLATRLSMEFLRSFLRCHFAGMVSAVFSCYLNIFSKITLQITVLQRVRTQSKTYFNQSLTESSDVIGMAFTCSTFRL